MTWLLGLICFLEANLLCMGMCYMGRRFLPSVAYFTNRADTIDEVIDEHGKVMTVILFLAFAFIVLEVVTQVDMIFGASMSNEGRPVWIPPFPDDEESTQGEASDKRGSS